MGGRATGPKVIEDPEGWNFGNSDKGKGKDPFFDDNSAKPKTTKQEPKKPDSKKPKDLDGWDF